MKVLRSLLFVVFLYGSMALVGLSFAPAAAFSRNAALMAGRVWCRIALWGARVFVGIEVRVEGREHIPTGAAIVAMKHQAMLDTIVPFILFEDPVIVLKRELLRAPVYGWFASRMNMIPVSRDAHAAALKEMLRAARPHAAAGRQIVIFPEGTRTAPGAHPEYKPGVAALYKDLGVAVTPVALNSGLCWPARGLVRRPGVVTIRFLEPIAPGLPRAAFMAALQERIETASHALLPGPGARADAKETA
jgi:1-acyl-sn-glycerol-3-phosphate acyltransferase